MAKNHPLMKDVKNWVLDSFSFMDGIGYDIQFTDDIFGMENTKAFSIDVDGLTDYDFEKGKENLIKSVPKKIKAEFPYLRISSARDGNFFVMFITLLDNNDYLEDTKLTYINLNESKKFNKKSLKEEYDPTDDIINKGNSVGMDYETFLKFAEKQDYRFNVTDATFHFAINNNIKIDGRECSCIPSEDGILIIDNHSSIEIPRKDIDEVSGVSLNSKNVLRMDVFTKDGHVLTVWWRL